ncbi:hypothetical protein [Blastopirellula marina]|uniref:hypothetical protein n=1 Tax=Blastopirellula marina TaxID=124 RepID=UPI0011B081D1|nr:hypothetical protein [Blastopirellula marina]
MAIPGRGGNRLTKTDDSGVTTYSYDAANRQSYSQTVSGRTSFTYDADGNQTQIESPLGELTTSTWDYENHVAQIENYFDG